MYKKLRDLFDIHIIYSVVFITLVAWALFAYFTMNKLIQEQKVYAKIINLSGKQRMLSQKTTLIAKRYFEIQNKSLKIHLKELIELMKKDHKFIIKNLPTKQTNIIYNSSPYNLNNEVTLYLSLLEKFYKTNDRNILSKIEEFSFSLLPKLNHAVNIFEKESDELTKSLLYREYFILIGTLITLFLEAIFIVIPSIRLAKQKEEELQKLNQILKYKIKKAVKENQKKENILKKQFRLAQMGEMITNIAHQWRQPLSVISSLASGIKVEKELNILDDKLLNDKLDNIIDKTIYLSSVLDNFDTFIKTNDEDIHLFSISKSVNTTVNILKGSFENEHINVSIKYPKTDIEIKGNSKKFRQAILNILSNAKDALKDNKGKREIKIRIINTKDSILITIENNGKLINEKIIHKIFDIYFTTKHQSQGTGLGLFISHEIITKYFKGSIRTKNLKNGVTFKINIPKET